MSILANLSISKKFFSVIGLLALMMGLGTIMLLNELRTDTKRYNAFLENDAQAAILLTGANRNLQAMAYSAYQIMTYDAATPEAKNANANFYSNVATFEKRVKSAMTLAPEYVEELQKHFATHEDVKKILTVAAQRAMENRNDEARVELAQADKLITPMAAEMRTLSDRMSADLVKNGNQLKQEADKVTFMATVIAAGTIFFGLGLAYFVAVSGVTRPLKEVTNRLKTLASGDNDTAIAGVKRRDEIGTIAKALEIFRDAALDKRRLEDDARNEQQVSEEQRLVRERQRLADETQLREAVDALGDGLQRLAQGDLRGAIPKAFAPHLDALRHDYNGTLDRLNASIQRIHENAKAMNSGAEEIRNAADDLSRRTEKQAASVEETAAALEEITINVSDSSKRASEAGQLVLRTKKNAEHSGDIVRNAIDAMGEIQRSSNAIASIIGVIDEIAFQTNLLALNAGVEAARAGEAGKGFAVVAQEVRELAQRSAKAAKEIKTLINSSSGQVSQGVTLVSDTGTALATIVGEVNEINLLVSAIVESAREQSNALAAINTAINNIDQNTQQNAAMVEQSSAASTSLASEAASLNALVGTFRTISSSDVAGQPQKLQADRKHAQAPSAPEQLRRHVQSAFAGNAALQTESWTEF